MGEGSPGLNRGAGGSGASSQDVLPGGESARLAALARYRILDTAAEPAYDDLTHLAAQICGTPIALMSLVDSTRQWFKSRFGYDVEELPRSVAFCDHAIRGEGLLEVPDAAHDDRFRDNPLVTGAPGIRFYAGMPLVTADGHGLGALCVIDRVPRRLEPQQRAALTTLARQVVTQLELRRALDAEQHAQRFARETIDALHDNIAIIDSGGTILGVNRAWSEFARANGAPAVSANLGPGANYLAVCERASGEGSIEAARVAAAVRAALAGEPGPASDLVEYPCHAPWEQRWFVARVSSFDEGAKRFAVVSHQDITARKRAEDALHALNRTLEGRVRSRTEELESAYESLRASESRFRTMFDNAAVGLTTATPDGRLMEMNDAFCAMAGRSAGDLAGTPIADLVDPRDRDDLHADRERLLAGRIPGFVRELRYLRPGGETIWVHASVAAVRDVNGHPSYTVALVQDVTPHKRAEYERDRFFQLSVDLLAIASVDDRLLRVNPAWTRVLGHSEEALLATGYLALIHPEDVERTRELLQGIAGGAPMPEGFLDVRMRQRGGGYRDIRWSAAPWGGEGLLVAVGRDVTRKKAAERALHERDMMLARAEEMAGMGSWDWDATEDRLSCSDGLLRIVGRPAEPRRWRLDDLCAWMRADDGTPVSALIARVRSDVRAGRWTGTVRRADGEARELLMFVEPKVDASGTLAGVSGACLDVTDFERAQTRARRSETDLRALAARLQSIREEERTRISREIHDELGQMLTALKMDLTLLGRDAAGSGTPLDSGRLAQDLGDMTRLVDATLGSVRRIARQLRPEVLDVLGLVPALEWQAEELQARTGLRCTVSVAGRMPDLDTERSTALFRIVQEALTNAVRHANASEVSVSLREAGGELRLSVTDDGCGFDPAHATAPSLGLLGIRERASSIGGHLELHSRDGEGTTLALRLPVDAPLHGAGAT